MEWYKDEWKFENLEEMAEYCRAYGEEVPDEFYINVDGEIEYFQLCAIGRYKISQCVRVYENTDCNKYIKFIYQYGCLYYELREFVYIDEDEKEHDIYSKLEDVVDDKKIDEIYEQIEARNVFITRIR